MSSAACTPVLMPTRVSMQYEPNYDNIECAAAWARESLDKHRSDKREHLYTKCAAPYIFHQMVRIPHSTNERWSTLRVMRQVS